MDGNTRDVTVDTIDTLKQIFPEVVADGKVDLDKLRMILGEEVEEGEERYSFTWPGKRDAIKLAISRNTGTLRPDKENSKDWDTTKNLFIEGDNLEVLRVLQNTYRGKVKMIYIDPPYNTGNDFVYKDNFVDNIQNYKELSGQAGQSNADTSGRYHTNWLNMMYPRLRLAKNLLCEDGLIFISIDDNEVNNLRKICDEIFGESNFVEAFFWKSIFRPSNMSRLVRKNAEYILCYSRNIDLLQEFVERTQDTQGDASLTKNQNKVRKLTFPAERVLCGLPDGEYPAGEFEDVILHDNVFVKDGLIKNIFQSQVILLYLKNIWTKKLIKELS